MDDLLSKLFSLKDSSIASIIDNRMKNFYAMKQQSDERIFQELCFCLFTANCASQKCWSVQDTLGEELLHLSETDLEQRLRSLGYRFPNRADRVVAARDQFPVIKDQLASNDSKALRSWLVQHVKGFGYKEASHFLRNIGFDDVAIIDVHILRVLEEYALITKPKTLTPKRYLEIEQLLESIAVQANLNLAELDLYLWYMRTGKVLK